MKDLRKYEKSRIDLLEVQRYLDIKDYIQLANTIKILEEDGIIKPVLNSGINSKKPSLYNRYSIIKVEEDNSAYIDELNYKLNFQLNTSYYMDNIKKYLEDREYILKLSEFLYNNTKLLDVPASLNERSFQIWGREKYLRDKGRTLLKRLKLSESKLNFYDTSEPLAYYSKIKDTPQSIVLIENKDTYYTLRRFLMSSFEPLFKVAVGTIIYGAGKGISKSFKDFEISLEPYLMDNRNQFLYLGDIDYEGILIYEQLYRTLKGQVEIKPFVEAYQYMVDKAVNLNIDLPQTKEGQNKNIREAFLNNFSLDYRIKILSILKEDKYIPQEIISFSDIETSNI